METKKINIQDLDASKVQVPIGYKVIIDPELIEQEKKEKELVQLEEIMKDIKEPSIEELVELGRIYHPYYHDLSRLEYLKK